MHFYTEMFITLNIRALDAGAAASCRIKIHLARFPSDALVPALVPVIFCLSGGILGLVFSNPFLKLVEAL